MTVTSFCGRTEGRTLARIHLTCAHHSSFPMKLFNDDSIRHCGRTLAITTNSAPGTLSLAEYQSTIGHQSGLYNILVSFYTNTQSYYTYNNVARSPIVFTSVMFYNPFWLFVQMLSCVPECTGGIIFSLHTLLDQQPPFSVRFGKQMAIFPVGLLHQVDFLGSFGWKMQLLLQASYKIPKPFNANPIPDPLVCTIYNDVLYHQQSTSTFWKMLKFIGSYKSEMYFSELIFLMLKSSGF